jgi:hypothetical protein
MDPRPVLPPFSGAVPVSGADFDAVADRYELDGDAEGWATVTGTWTGRLIRVEQQATTRLSVPDDPPRWEVPPCPPPPGGWPRGLDDRSPDNLEFDVGDLKQAGAAIMIVTFRPGPGQAVLVVTAADPRAVEDRLRPQLGPRLCVVPSRWTKGEIDAVHDHLHDRLADWGIYQLGIEALEDAQAQVTAKASKVVQELADWAASLPPGILRLDPWLRPDAGSRGKLP